MAAVEESCQNDPNFAVICSFIEKFGGLCGIHVSIDDLQTMLEDTKHVNETLKELHVQLLRKMKKCYNKDKWEKAVIKFCHGYNTRDAWEFERFGYKKAKLSCKLQVLKNLLESQFETSNKFKTEVNKFGPDDLRILPLGRDVQGHSYWYQCDDELNIRLYREIPDEDTSWTLLCKERDDLSDLLNKLQTGECKYFKDEGSSTNISENGDSNLTAPGFDSKKDIKTENLHTSVEFTDTGQVLIKDNDETLLSKVLDNVKVEPKGDVVTTESVSEASSFIKTERDADQKKQCTDVTDKETIKKELKVNDLEESCKKELISESKQSIQAINDENSVVDLRTKCQEKDVTDKVETNIDDSTSVDGIPKLNNSIVVNNDKEDNIDHDKNGEKSTVISVDGADDEMNKPEKVIDKQTEVIIAEETSKIAESSPVDDKPKLSNEDLNKTSFAKYPETTEISPSKTIRKLKAEFGEKFKREEQQQKINVTSDCVSNETVKENTSGELIDLSVKRKTIAANDSPSVVNDLTVRSNSRVDAGDSAPNDNSLKSVDDRHEIGRRDKKTCGVEMKTNRSSVHKTLTGSSKESVIVNVDKISDEGASVADKQKKVVENNFSKVSEEKSPGISESLNAVDSEDVSETNEQQLTSVVKPCRENGDVLKSEVDSNKEKLIETSSHKKTVENVTFVEKSDKDNSISEQIKDKVCKSLDLSTRKDKGIVSGKKKTVKVLNSSEVSEHRIEESKSINELKRHEEDGPRSFDKSEDVKSTNEEKKKEETCKRSGDDSQICDSKPAKMTSEDPQNLEINKTVVRRGDKSECDVSESNTEKAEIDKQEDDSRSEDDGEDGESKEKPKEQHVGESVTGEGDSKPRSDDRNAIEISVTEADEVKKDDVTGGKESKENGEQMNKADVENIIETRRVTRSKVGSVKKSQETVVKKDVKQKKEDKSSVKEKSSNENIATKVSDSGISNVKSTKKRSKTIKSKNDDKEKNNNVKVDKDVTAKTCQKVVEKDNSNECDQTNVPEIQNDICEPDSPPVKRTSRRLEALRMKQIEEQRDREKIRKENEVKDAQKKLAARIKATSNVNSNVQEENKSPMKTCTPKGRTKKHDEQQQEIQSQAKKKKKKKKSSSRKGHQPWDVSSDGSSSEETEEIEPEEEVEEELHFDENYDEFAPEEFDENEEPVIIKRARTLKEEDCEACENDDVPCGRCGKYDHPEWILLCDKCDTGYHASCLQPPLMIIPVGNWYCPPCEQNMLCENLIGELKKLDSQSKKKEALQLRKQRLAYVGINLDNVLKPEKSEEKPKKRAHSVEGEDDTSSSEESTSESESSSNESDGQYVMYSKRTCRQRGEISYKFSEFDELINSAIQQEVMEEPGFGKGKDMSNITNAENETVEGDDEERPGIVKISKRKKKPRLNDLDATDEDDDNDEEYKGSNDSASELDLSEEAPSSSGEEESDGILAKRSKRNSRKSRRKGKKSKRAKKRRSKHSFVVSSDSESEASDDFVPRRKAARKRINYKESSDDDDDDEEEEIGNQWKQNTFKVYGKANKRIKSSSESDAGWKKSKKKRKNVISDLDDESEESIEEESSEEDNDEVEPPIDKGSEKIKTREKEINFRKLAGSDESADEAEKKVSKKEKIVDKEEDDEESSELEGSSDEEDDEEETPSKKNPPPIIIKKGKIIKSSDDERDDKKETGKNVDKTERAEDNDAESSEDTSKKARNSDNLKDDDDAVKLKKDDKDDNDEKVPNESSNTKVDSSPTAIKTESDKSVAQQQIREESGDSYEDDYRSHPSPVKPVELIQNESSPSYNPPSSPSQFTVLGESQPPAPRPPPPPPVFENGRQIPPLAVGPHPRFPPGFTPPPGNPQYPGQYYPSHGYRQPHEGGPRPIYHRGPPPQSGYGPPLYCGPYPADHPHVRPPYPPASSNYNFPGPPGSQNYSAPPPTSGPPPPPPPPESFQGSSPSQYPPPPYSYTGPSNREQNNGGFMIDNLLQRQNREGGEEDDLSGLTDIVSYITQE